MTIGGYFHVCTLIRYSFSQLPFHFFLVRQSQKLGLGNELENKLDKYDLKEFISGSFNISTFTTNFELIEQSKSPQMGLGKGNLQGVESHCLLNGLRDYFAPHVHEHFLSILSIRIYVPNDSCTN